MARHRCFVDSEVPVSGVVPLSPADVHHLRAVARVLPGEEIVVVHAGRALAVRLAVVGDELIGDVIGEASAPASAPVTLVQSLAKGEKMDDVVRQATEIGVARIVPLAASRSIVKLDAGKAADRQARWQRIANEAAKQSQRGDIPQVTAVATIDTLGDVLAGSVVLVCWEEADPASDIDSALVDAQPRATTDVAVVIGPEGGLSAGEVKALVAAGARTVSLGQTILRTETAAVVATALVMHARSALGRRDD